MIRGIERLVRSRVFVRHAVDGNQALDNFIAERLDQIRVRGPAGQNPFDVLSRLIPLAQDDRRIRHVGTGDDHIGFRRQNLLQLGAIAWPVRLVHDAGHDLAALLFPRLLEAFGVADTGGVIERHRCRPLPAALFGNHRERGAEAIVGGLKAPHQILGVQRRDGRGARAVHFDDAGGVGQRHHSQRNPRRPGAEYRLHLVDFDQFLGGEHGGIRFGLAVFVEEFQFPSARTSGGVHLSDSDLDRLLHAAAVRTAGAGDRAQRTDAERRGCLCESETGHRGRGGQTSAGEQDIAACDSL